MQTIQRKFQDFNGTRISFLEKGSGEPFVMLHGLMSNAWDYAFQFQTFADRYRCLAPDMRGCGLTHAPDASAVTLEQAVADAAAFIDAAAPDGEQVTLMGHSFGGVLALELLARFPERFRKVILVAAPAEMPGNPLLKIAMPLYGRAVQLLDRRLIHFYAFNVNVMPANVTPQLKQVLRTRNRYLSRSDALAMGAYFKSILNWDIPDLSGSQSVPALMVFGSKDYLVSNKSCAILTKKLPGARCETIRDSRHSPMYEQPGAFDAILESFLDGAAMDKR
jgi:pimeloyl-ACP methyl ester carboxylesterase